MSKEVKRYDPFGYDGLSALMHEDVLGDYVRHEDYDALLAERDAISQITEIRCEGCGYMVHDREHMGCVRAAKSGGPSLRELRMLDALEYALPYLEACIPNPRNGVNHDGSLDVNAVQRARDAIASCRAAMQGDQL
ncbi:hypothetical protein N5J76_03130 [Pseudomonas sp. GD03855]|nr:hypothetical protein [Pseudomonas sp. GD03856]MDH2263913.1 hypothetical protein [Pseudomonas sp. GD03855]